MTRRPSESPSEQTSRVLAEVNADHGLELSLIGRCAAGVQTGAWLLVDAAGDQAILKWHPDGSATELRELAAVVERLRATGYPTPAWLAAGVTTAGAGYHVQRFATGLPATPPTGAPMSMSTAGLLIEVLERQAGLDPAPGRDRSAAAVRDARDESPGSSRHHLRGLGEPGAALLARYDALLATAPAQLPGGDLVHGDFNTCNLLLDGSRVSAVIDVEELGSGTRVIDYAGLLREAYVEDYGDEVRLLLRRVAEAVAGPGVLVVCAAAAAFFIAGFKAAHQPDRVPATLAALHRMAADLARPI